MLINHWLYNYIVHFYDDNYHDDNNDNTNIMDKIRKWKIFLIILLASILLLHANTYSNKLSIFYMHYIHFVCFSNTTALNTLTFIRLDCCRSIWYSDENMTLYIAFIYWSDVLVVFKWKWISIGLNEQCCVISDSDKTQKPQKIIWSLLIECLTTNYTLFLVQL